MPPATKKATSKQALSSDRELLPRSAGKHDAGTPRPSDQRV